MFENKNFYFQTSLLIALKISVKASEKNNKSILRDNFAYYKETGSVNTK
jgi:hypothetical protein